MQHVQFRVPCRRSAGVGLSNVPREETIAERIVGAAASCCLIHQNED